MDLIETAVQKGPSILVLDQIDLIASKDCSKESIHSSPEKRLFELLKGYLDQRSPISSPSESRSDGVFIIGITDRFHVLDPEIYRSGRLDTVILNHVSHKHQRQAILQHLLRNSMDLIKDSDTLIPSIAQITLGFVHSDLDALCRQVVVLKKKSSQDSSPNAYLILDDFEESLKMIRPAAIQEWAQKIPRVDFSNVFGLDDSISFLKRAIIKPFLDPSEFEQRGIHLPRGIVIQGPPGVGKSLLSFALVNELGLSCIYIDGPKIQSKIVGESEAAITKLFAKARENSPCVLLMDQLDTIVPKRGSTSSSENTSERIITTFLTEMDGILTQKTDPSQSILMVAGKTLFLVSNSPQLQIALEL
jgi:SpoVK/Ycf46/Vps4 family AAA+-type ATPase